LITQNDFDFCLDDSSTAGDVMKKVDRLILGNPQTSLDAAWRKLLDVRKKVLPLVNRKREVIGMYVFSDLKRLKTDTTSLFNVDSGGHLRVGAAIGTNDDEFERATELIKAGCDVIVIDTAHGNSKNVVSMLKKLKRRFADTDVVVGNVSEGDAARRLVRAGADGIKVGQGPGSICTTRIIAGVGCPQVTAVYNCEKAIRGSGVPICADGGITTSGDITIAIAAGADCVMLGGKLAGTYEAPGEILEIDGKKVKMYRGMGSQGAMQDSQAARERYGHSASDKKFVPEGVESIVPYIGTVAGVMEKFTGGLRSGLGYEGAKNIQFLKRHGDFIRITGAGMEESRPHDVQIIEVRNK
jgi:IMP dehydrogenase